MRIDFTGVADGGFEAIPAGTYNATVFDIEHKESKKGNQYYSWIFKIQDGQYEGRKFWHNTTLTKESLWNLKMVLKGMGVSREERESSQFDFQPSNFIGKPCRIVLRYKEDGYNGEPENNIRRVLPPESPDANPTEAPASSVW